MKNGKVVILDDVTSHLLLLQTILEGDGYDAIAFNDQKKALDYLNKQKTDVLLLDIMMPELDGFQILDKIKKNPKIKDIYVIIISAKTDAQSIKIAINKGAFDYITKPINIQDLKNKVRAAMKDLGYKK